MRVIFETQRLVVRVYSEDDKDNFFLLNGNPDVMRFIRPVKSREEADAFLLQVIDYSRQTGIYGRWAVVDKISEEFIGSFALIPVENSEKMQLGYALLPQHWRKGYATELTREGLRYVFTKTSLDVIYAYTELPNILSQQVLLKCGFIQTGKKEDGEKTLLEFMLEKTTG